MERFQMIFKEYQDDGKSVVMVNIDTGDELKMKIDVWQRYFDYTVNITVVKI